MEACHRLWFLVLKRKRSRKHAEPVGSALGSRFQKTRFWKRDGTIDSCLEALNLLIRIVNNNKKEKLNVLCFTSLTENPN